MKVINKFKLRGEDNIITLPIGSDILKVDNQHDEVTMWVELDPDETYYEARLIKIIPTGALFEDVEKEYIGTVLICKGNYVWHVYEVFGRK